MRPATIGVLLRHAWARHRVPLVAIAAAVAAFEFIMTRMAPAPSEVSWMSGLLAAMPRNIMALVGNEMALTPAGFLAIGYAHPFFLLLQAVWVVRVSSAAIAGEIGLGTMDLLASRSVPRWHFVAAGVVTIAIGLAVIAGSACAATAMGVHIRPIGVGPATLAPVAAAMWLLFFACGAVGLLIGSTRRDGGQAIAWTTAFIAASFVLDYLARLWAPIARLRPWSLFRYYEPQAIVASGLSRTSLMVLGATIAIGTIASVIAVNRRDF